MDFKALLSIAQQNDVNKQAVTPCYQTKFIPQKKQTKQSKALSQNIKKFLARQEEEKKQKALIEQKKKENLLALRDHKAQSRINKHLKVCKSANKSVLADAIDNENTAITMAGPSQPDEDDYGYVSQEAAALHNQLMAKYNKIPEKPLFSNTEKRTVTDLASTKDRLKQAFKQQELGSDGQKRKRKSSTLNAKEIEVDEKIETKKVKEEDKDEKSKPKKKPPPPIDFAELLKLAEKKQHEPVFIEVKPKVEEERPMTKRQQQEYLKEKERKEHREKTLETNKKSNVTNTLSKLKVQSNKVPGTNEKSATSNPTPNKNISKTLQTIPKKITNKPIDKSSSEKSDSSKISSKNELLEERKKLEAERKQLEEMRRLIEEEKKKLKESQNRQEETKSQIKSSDKIMNKSKIADKQVSSKNVKPRQFPPADLKMNSLLVNNKPKQFPPPDVRPSKLKRKPLGSCKRRIYDDDEEYDSDMKDFIDDGVENDNEDYSKYISEIFGYDKSKYRHMDEEDDSAMESNFAQQLKEEFISTKIGIMEDLEDMRMEAMQKKQKCLIKKK